MAQPLTGDFVRAKSKQEIQIAEERQKMTIQTSIEAYIGAYESINGLRSGTRVSVMAYESVASDQKMVVSVLAETPEGIATPFLDPYEAIRYGQAIVEAATRAIYFNELSAIAEAS